MWRFLVLIALGLSLMAFIRPSTPILPPNVLAYPAPASTDTPDPAVLPPLTPPPGATPPPDLTPPVREWPPIYLPLTVRSTESSNSYRFIASR